MHYIMSSQSIILNRIVSLENLWPSHKILITALCYYIVMSQVALEMFEVFGSLSGPKLL